MNRPLGVRVISGVVAFSGVLGVFASLGVPNALTPVFAALSLLLLFGAYGLWALRAWGWILVFAVYAPSLLANLVIGGLGSAEELSRFAIGVVVVAYLYHRRDLYFSEDRGVSLSPR